MSFKKDKMITSKGVIANYHTITNVMIDISRLPTEEIPGPMSKIRVSSFASREFYLQCNGNTENALDHKIYSVPLDFSMAVLATPDAAHSAYEKAENKIIELDSFFSDAERVQ